MFVALCDNECLPCVCRYPKNQEEGIRTPGAGLTSGCELPGVDAGNQTEARTQPWSHFYSLLPSFVYVSVLPFFQINHYIFVEVSVNSLRAFLMLLMLLVKLLSPLERAAYCT